MEALDIRTIERSPQAIRCGEFAYAGFRIALASVLAIAAALKAHSLSLPMERASDGINAIAIVWEVALAILLLWHGWPRLTQFLTVGTFATFSMITLASIALGRSSCGCLGFVEIPPVVTLAVDCSILLAAILLYRFPARPPARLLGVAMPLVAVLGLVAATFVSIPHLKASLVSADGMTNLPTGDVLLMPERWVGKPLPLLPHLQDGERLSRGAHRVLLYRPDCEECREVLRSVYRSEPSGSTTSWVLIDISGTSAARHESSGVHEGSITPTLITQLNGARWMVATPTVIDIDDGIVVRTSGGV